MKYKTLNIKIIEIENILLFLTKTNFKILNTVHIFKHHIVTYNVF